MKLNYSIVTMAAVAVFALLFPASARTAHSEYDVKHSFNLKLKAQAGQVYRGRWKWDAHAKAVDKTGIDTGSPPQSGSYSFTPAASDYQDDHATRSGALGFAATTFEATAAGTGFHEVFGSADVTPPDGLFARGSSLSRLGLNIGTMDRRGQIVWHAGWHVETIQGGAAKARDPILITIIDLDTGGTQDSTLWDTGCELLGPGTTDWSNGHLQINAAEGSYYLTMESPYLTSPQGHINLTFHNGLVTSSDTAGLFAGLAPVGSSSLGLNLTIGDANGDVALDYDFGPDNQNGFDTGMNVDTDGLAEAVPEPASMAVLAMSALTLAGRRRRRT